MLVALRTTKKVLSGFSVPHVTLLSLHFHLVYGSFKNLILSDGMITDRNIFPTYQIVKDENQLLDWKNFFQRYFCIKADILREIEALKKDMFLGKKTLGVLCRGTDYTRNPTLP